MSVSDKKTKKDKRKAKAEADKMTSEEASLPSKKQAVQGLSSASSPASVASASPKIPPVVAPVAPLASKRAVKTAVRFEYGYPIEGHHYRPSDEFSDDDDDASIILQLRCKLFSSCCDWVRLFFWIFYFIFFEIGDYRIPRKDQIDIREIGTQICIV